MSSITTMNSLVAAIDAAAGLNETWNKGSLTATNGAFSSLWTAGGNPAPGAAQGSNDGAICDKNTVGAFTRLVNAGAGRNHLLSWEGFGANVSAILLYDRLWHSSGHSGIVTGPTSFTQPALTRYTDGVGVEAWLDVYGAIGSTSRVATISFTHPTLGSGKSATLNTIASQAIGQCVRFTGPETDALTSIQSVGLSASTGTAGNYGLTLRKQIGIVTAATGNVKDAIRAALREVKSDACLEILVLANTTSTGAVQGNLVVG